MTYVILSACVDVKDGACVDVCPVDCIHEFPDQYAIDPDECIFCGLCESVCPVDAIREIDEVPDDEKEYIAINRAYFEDS
ncbi:MAG: 4Fe-4S binding protein [Haliea sp.]|uniref:indolepyruvate ferredoxin oxidoreductase subunit alpha n=1 Tax=Marinobacter salarius TaxID=1420917 RepID=UPI0032EF0B44